MKLKIFGKTVNQGGYAERMFGDFADSDMSSGYLNCVQNGGAEVTLVAESNGVPAAFILATFSCENHHRRDGQGEVVYPEMVDAARVGKIINSPLGQRLLAAFNAMSPADYADLVDKTAREVFGQSESVADFAAADKAEKELNALWREINAAKTQARMAARAQAKAEGLGTARREKAAEAAADAAFNEFRPRLNALLYKLGAASISVLQSYACWGYNEAAAFMDNYRRENGLPDPRRGYENPCLD